MRRRLLALAAPLALFGVLALAPDALAQVRIGGGGVRIGGGGSGVTIGGPGYGGWGYGSGYGSPGYGGWGYGSGYGSPGWGSGYGYPGYGGSGTSIGIGNRGWGYGSYPGYSYGGYSSGSYYPGYSYGGYSSFSPGYTNSYPASGYTYASPSYGSSTGVVAGGTTSGYQSFYPADGGQANDGSRAMIRVHVPADAQVLFEGAPTKQMGPERVFMTPPLAQGSNYSYTITAQWMENGREVKRSRTVNFHAGKQVDVDFRAGQAQGDRPAGSEETSEPQPPQSDRPRNNNNNQLNPQPVPPNPGNALPATESRDEPPNRRPPQTNPPKDVQPPEPR